MLFLWGHLFPWGVLVLLKFSQSSSELTKAWSSGATECRVWLGNCNVKVWKSTEHKLQNIWPSLKFAEIQEYIPVLGFKDRVYALSGVLCCSYRMNSSYLPLSVTSWWSAAKSLCHLLFQALMTVTIGDRLDKALSSQEQCLKPLG